MSRRHTAAVRREVDAVDTEETIMGRRDLGTVAYVLQASERDVVGGEQVRGGVVSGLSARHSPPVTPSSHARQTRRPFAVDHVEHPRDAASEAMRHPNE